VRGERRNLVLELVEREVSELAVLCIGNKHVDKLVNTPDDTHEKAADSLTAPVSFRRKCSRKEE
jgi:hypothetical protein